MNPSVFYVWENFKPRILSILAFMKTDFRQKIGWENRLRQAILWSIATVVVDLLSVEARLWLTAKLLLVSDTLPPLVFFCGSLILFLVSLCGLLGTLTLLIGIPVIFAITGYRELKKKKQSTG